DFLKQQRRPWSVDCAQRYFAVSQHDAMALVTSLLSHGFIKETEGCSYTTTIKGNALAHASAAPRVCRATATRNVSAFLERVHAANDNPAFAFRVIRVAVFGSYLGPADRLSDVDLAITFAPRYSGAAH